MVESLQWQKFSKLHISRVKKTLPSKFLRGAGLFWPIAYVPYANILHTLILQCGITSKNTGAFICHMFSVLIDSVLFVFKTFFSFYPEDFTRRHQWRHRKLRCAGNISFLIYECNYSIILYPILDLTHIAFLLIYYRKSSSLCLVSFTPTYNRICVYDLVLEFLKLLYGPGVALFLQRLWLCFYMSSYVYLT